VKSIVTARDTFHEREEKKDASGAREKEERGKGEEAT